MWQKHSTAEAGGIFMNGISIRPYAEQDIPAMCAIWNEIVAAGNAFPQEEQLDAAAGSAFFAAQSFCGIAEDTASGTTVGLYILHPNNVGRCGHIANASYAVASGCRGRHIGEALVRDCMAKAKEIGFRMLQFNAVVATNLPARRLYARIGFTQLGTIPGGFRLKDGSFADICPYYIEL